MENNLLAVMEMLGMDSAARTKRLEGLLSQFDIAPHSEIDGALISGGEKAAFGNRPLFGLES